VDTGDEEAEGEAGQCRGERVLGVVGRACEEEMRDIAGGGAVVGAAGVNR
jgi:hypothetical protein